jgi:2-hydroxychromene-2-carboxylate isomerase
MSLVTSPRTRALRRAAASASRRLRGSERTVHYFHQADDPYGALAVQSLPALVARYEIALMPQLVAPPSDAAAPERALLEAYARRDAADVAGGYGLAFPADAAAPAPETLALAQRVLVSSIARGRFVSDAARVCAALWSDAASSALPALASDLGEASPADTDAALAAGSALRERRGHYLGAMFHYEGEWYWGVDRLHHLERRLREEGALRDGADGEPLVARPALAGGAREAAAARPVPRAPETRAKQEPVALEFFASLRSPYTYIAAERVYGLAKHYGVALALRPVLPMVMRGLPVPPAKRLYIALDTKREAEAAGIPFGRICDPVGRPVERCFSLYPWARAQGRAAELLLEFMRAAWAEGVDTGADAGLRRVALRAGLAWAEARTHLDRDEGWRAELEANRAELFALGLWGVPSFRVRGGGAPDYATWGQDRLWRVEQELRARLANARP